MQDTPQGASLHKENGMNLRLAYQNQVLCLLREEALFVLI